MSAVETLEIARVGAQGDGVAEGIAGPVFVPFTLAGERVAADVEGERGSLISIEKASVNRITPVCRHFGTCGGCAVQHMARETYLAWKHESVTAAFRARGIAVEIAPVIGAIGKRRRATFAARKTQGGIFIGFHQAGTHDLVAIEECPVLEPQIVAALPDLKWLVAPLLSRRGEVRVAVTSSHGGLDINLEDADKTLNASLRAHFAKAVQQSRFARISIDGDPAMEASKPIQRFGLAEVVPPPGSFLQAVAGAEAKMAELILQSAGKVKAVADLFCGVGAFTFPLAEKARVLACDSDKAAIAALQFAAKNTQGLKPVEGLVRDLFREPLSGLELKDFDAVVFDPPRAGAEAQAQRIAKSKVKTAIGVSCNPATLARDARILIDGGYTLESVTPVDQFLYSPHVEAVAVFRR